jgi:hypothetical protein
MDTRVHTGSSLLLPAASIKVSMPVIMFSQAILLVSLVDVYFGFATLSLHRVRLITRLPLLGSILVRMLNRHSLIRGSAAICRKISEVGADWSRRSIRGSWTIPSVCAWNRFPRIILFCDRWLTMLLRWATMR